MREKKLWMMLSAMLLLVVLCLLASCSCGETQTPVTTTTADTEPVDTTPTDTTTEKQPLKLTAPVVVLTGDTATWSADNLADRFEVSLDGVLSYLENSVIAKKLSDGQSFKIRAIGDGVNYLTSDWSNTVTYTNESKTYTVTWKNGDIVLGTDQVEQGALPTYDGATPTKEATAEFSYTFKGWTPEISAVTGDVTYSAEFEATIRTYTVTWYLGSTVLEIDTVEYGTVPTYDGATPTKEATAQYSYLFKGWTPEITAVTGDANYSADFDRVINTYTVTFCSEDGMTVLDIVTVEYGSTAVYTKSLPVKNATEGFTYEFDKWVTEIGSTVGDDLTNVIADRTVYASFKNAVRTVTVYIVSNNTEYGSVSLATIDNVPFGSAIMVSGDKVTVNGTSVTATPKVATAEYTYAFEGWTADATVGNDTTIKANFDRTLNTYTITWKNGDTVLEVDQNVPYGSTPVYNGATPSKPADALVYTFTGWTPAIATVTKDATYTAQFTDATNVHTVIFYDENGTTELGRVVVEHGKKAVYPNALPTKASTVDKTFTFDKWVTAKGGSTTADLNSITADRAVYAKFKSQARLYTVSFYDYDGTLLQSSQVPYGQAATAPGNPDRDGYRFNGWDGVYTNVSKDQKVTAKYVKQVAVTFVDYDGSIIDVKRADVNGSVTAPVDPSRNGYRFTGWNTSFTHLAADLTVKAEYIKQYKVTFMKADKTVLKEVTVDVGASVTAPSAPSLEGYDFKGWDSVLTNVTSDMTVTPIYQLKTYTVQFVMPNGTAIGEKQTVEHGFSAVEPEYPAYYMTGTGDQTKFYAFTKWEKDFDHVTGNLTVKAVYDLPYTAPVIVVEYSSVRNGDVKLYVNCSNKTLNAIAFSISYKSATGNIIINKATVASASLLAENNQSVINNNDKTFAFAWSDGNGKAFDWCSELITFNFSVQGTEINTENFVIDSCSAVVSDADGENLEKITPVVIYR